MPKKKSKAKSEDITDESTAMAANGVELENLDPNHEDVIKVRRAKVLQFWVNGYSTSEIAEKIDCGERTITRDLTEIKKERAKMVQQLIAKFDINSFIARRLRGIEKRRQVMTEALESVDAPQVRISAELRELDIEEEDIYRRLGVKTSEVNPEQLMGTKIGVFTGAPPPGYKLPEDFEKLN